MSDDPHNGMKAMELDLLDNSGAGADDSYDNDDEEDDQFVDAKFMVDSFDRRPTSLMDCKSRDGSIDMNRYMQYL
jgi:hypothetical protein